MADACSERIIGAEVYFSVGDIIFEAMGDVTIKPGRVSREASATAGGKVVVVEKSDPPSFSCDFANITGERDPMILWEARCGINVTAVEKGRGIRHLFTNCTIVGSPEINISTGIVSGIEGVTDSYSKTG